MIAAGLEELKEALRRLDERRFDELLLLERGGLRERVRVRAELRFIDRERVRLADRLDRLKHRPQTTGGAVSAWVQAKLALLGERLDEWAAHH